MSETASSSTPDSGSTSASGDPPAEAETGKREDHLAPPADPPRDRRRFALPIGLGAGAALVALTVLFATRDALGAWAIGLGIAALLAGAAPFFFYRELTGDEQDLVDERRALDALREGLDEEMHRLDSRTRELEDKLTTYSEWMEFPKPVAFGRTDELAAGGQGEEEAEEEEERPPDEVRARDAEVSRLIRTRGDEIMEMIRKDEFREDGKFQIAKVLSEMIRLIDNVARIQQPEADEPLLETSLERLLKAVNRASTQLLFQIDGLPLNVKDLNLARAYEHFRQAADLYGYYKKLSPYVPIASYTWHLGRLVSASNPITAGTWFLGTEIIRRGGSTLTKKYIDRYALRLIQDFVRIIGTESASLFDAASRYRDPTWIYAAELTELVSVSPMSRRTLQGALNEVGKLPFRSSYDRVFVYRCLAGGKSAKPGNFARPEWLTPRQRAEIARRLENFAENHVGGVSAEASTAWREGVSDRLRVSMGDEAWASSTPQEEAANALRSLAGYLADIRGLEPDQFPEPLASTAIADRLPGGGAEAIDELVASPPAFFEYPEIDPSGAILEDFFHDLIALDAHLGPPDDKSVYGIQDLAVYFRRDPQEWVAALLEAHAGGLVETMEEDSPVRELRPDVMTALVGGLLAEGETIRFVYKGQRPKSATNDRWLVGTSARLLLFEESEAGSDTGAHLLWEAAQGAPGLRAAKRGTRIREGCALVGGSWQPNVTREEEVLLRGQALGSFEKHFAALGRWLRGQGSEGPTESAPSP